MASIISAGTTSGTALNMAGDTSGVLQFQTNGTTAAVTIDTSQNLQFNSGYGSVAVAYGCRAWVNFNGTGTVAIRASGNVSSITDEGVGNYRVNFTAAMPNLNYSILVAALFNAGVTASSVATLSGDIGGIPTTSNFLIYCYNTDTNAAFDSTGVYASIFR
jgi:hypothetical protein